MKYKEFPTWAHIIILLLSSLYAWVLLFKVNEWGAFPTPKENWRFAVLAGVLGVYAASSVFLGIVAAASGSVLSDRLKEMSFGGK
ncbi:hypothetical protein [Paracoccus kondratievae]|uniref:Uncharacterized protein n=1 Tax=Paracoccus kondratievae TaxID=135740 RepID=A0AAD3NYM2_9RHOB|nr:hypothetical protein [Paracoccus kondratievae]GLK64332.1 hypothetical protein GCM10017635_18030 [Paracoccus kondratievae]